MYARTEHSLSLSTVRTCQSANERETGNGRDSILLLPKDQTGTPCRHNVASQMQLQGFPFHILEQDGMAHPWLLYGSKQRSGHRLY